MDIRPMHGNRDRKEDNGMITTLLNIGLLPTLFIAASLLTIALMVICYRLYEQVLVAARSNQRMEGIIAQTTRLSAATEQQDEQDSIKDLKSKYLQLFNSSISGISFCSKDGDLVELNDKMKKMAGFDKMGDAFFSNTSMFNIPLIGDDFNRDAKEPFHACQHMYYPKLNLDLYVEIVIRPVLNDKGEVAYYMFLTNDVTNERNTYLELKKRDKDIIKANDAISHYEEELHYLLKETNTYVWRTDLVTKTIHFTQSLREEGVKETIEDYFTGMSEKERDNARETFKHIISQNESINIVHRLERTPLGNIPEWYVISGVPVLNKKGILTGHMGIVRNVTDFMEVQEKLKLEKARAEDSGKLKSAFLANMTHEIRTPLNAIIGFSDLLQMVDDPQEKEEFIRIIRNNCDMLLRLIDDILEVSTQSHDSQSISPEVVDFSKVFDDICQTLEQRVQEPAYPTYPTTLDKGRIQQVITNFTTNAVKYTHKGHIKVGYEERTMMRSDNSEMTKGLYIYCEDTGAGIPKEKQASVFERFVKLNDFVQGFGLGLSICKNIATKCGGQIGIESEGEGHGSTFWIWIPCEKKNEEIK